MLRLDLLSNGKVLLVVGKAKHGNVLFKNVEEQLQKTGRGLPAAEDRQKTTVETGSNQLLEHSSHKEFYLGKGKMSKADSNY